MKTALQIAANEIEWTVSALPEDQSPEDCFASGNDEQDKTTCQRIREDAEWNEWAWCCVEVKGQWNGLEAVAYLGACSYLNQKDFMQEGGYYADLQREVIDQLQSQTERIVDALN